DGCQPRRPPASRAGRRLGGVRRAARAGPPAFQAAGAWAGRLAGLSPQPWAPDYATWAGALPAGSFETLWLSDGIDHPGRAGLLSAVQGRGPVTVFESARTTFALRPARFEDGAVALTALRLPALAEAQSVEVSARGPDPGGIERELARIALAFEPGAAVAEAALSVPPEIRNRLTRFEIAGLRSAAAVSLADDSLRRRKVALIAGQAGEAEGLQLLSPLHYLRQALEPVAEMVNGTLADVILASPDVIVLADVARLAPAEAADLTEWVDKGGLLLRFAGPRLAASDVSRSEEDPLMPVRLREGGRTVGGAMSWGEPKALAPFREGTPFFGLALPDDVTVTAQVLAQPDPTLAERTVATLADGTPLVTRKAMGQGQVVLVHVTANAEWSTLPLSGLFVQMLERLAVSTRPAAPGAADLAGQVWTPEVALDAFGALSAAGDRPGVEGEALAAALTAGPSAAMPPGLYSGDDRRVALNVIGAETPLAAFAWPAGVTREGMAALPERAMKGPLLTLALVLLLVDVIAALAVAGRLAGGLSRAALLVMAVAVVPAPAPAQTRT
ncbi:MAG TPA: LytTR family transcriptional regulator, partial [Paracoccaceae bacterium]|nr:LytTR family transcriptional regulator [Paracoccaceae bacterium]